MMLQDQLITASFILGGSQQAHLQVFQNLLLVCRKLPSLCFCHPRTVKKSGAVVPQKVISSLPARGLSPQKPRPRRIRTPVVVLWVVKWFFIEIIHQLSRMLLGRV